MDFLKKFYLLFIVIIAFTSFKSFANSSLKSPKQLQYTFTYLNNNEKPVLNVSLQFKSNSEERTIIELPSHFGGAEELYKNISDIKVIGAYAEKTKDPTLLDLYHAPNSNIIINYNVTQGWDGPLSDFQHYLAPIFQKSYFQFIGNGVLIYPQSYKNEKTLKLLLDWKIPSGWKIANSYGKKDLHQEITANFANVLDASFISGNYRFHNINVKGGIISTAIQGKWPFQEKYFSETVTNIINNERNFWNDHNFPWFLVTLIPIETTAHGMAGTALTNAFHTFLESNYSLNYPVWYVISHESFHTWNTPDIFDVSEENAIYFYWFSEGFTDYYANLLNLRINLINLPDYIKQFNKMLVDYYSSPVNSSTIEQVKEKFWKDCHINKEPF